MGFITPYRLVLRLFLLISLSFVVGARLNGHFFEFTQPVYNVSIPENARGKIFAITEGPEPIAVLIPFGTSGEVKFKIVSGDEGNLFRVVNEAMGNKVFLRVRLRPSLQVALNRELKDEYILVVKARLIQSGKRNLETTTQIRIKVRDGNDLVPLFLPDSYAITIKEDLQPLKDEIVQVQASDADQGLNGQVYYTLIDAADSDFTVHPVSGKIHLIRHLNSNIKPSYVLQIKAEDRASRLFRGPAQYSYVSTASVSIEVQKSNEHPPRIIVEDVVPAFKNRTKIQIVAVIRVEDDDEYVHGQLKSINIIGGNHMNAFTLVPHQNEVNSFVLQTIPGAILPTDIDEYNLELLSIDRGFPPLNSTASLKIIIKEPPPNPLNFQNDTFHFVINETALINSVVGCLSLGNTWVPTVQMQILSHLETETPFNLDSKSGLLTLKTALDREIIDKYVFKVIATAPNMKSVESTVMVTVLEENDHAPQFKNSSENLRLTLRLDTAPESVIAKVEAVDEDGGLNKLTYRLADVTGPSKHPFIVDQFTGEIKLIRGVRKDDGPTWVVWVRVADDAAPLRRESETHIIINLEGYEEDISVETTGSPALLNSHTPQFIRAKYSIKVPEDTGINEALYPAIVAVDPDPGYSGLVRYVLNPSGNEEGRFAIDMYSGALRLVQRLDNDLRPSREVYTLNVRAEDSGGKFDEVNVEIEVVDVNDHAPVFHRPKYAVTIDEDVRVDTELVKVVASDDDTGVRGDVRYRFISKTTDFVIDKDSGVVSVASDLDRERFASYHLVIQAYDGGHPPQKSNVPLEITVNDINDNVPRCVRKHQKVQLTEDWPIGALVTCIHAQDEDYGVNSDITYQLEDTDYFRMDEDTGCVFVQSEVDFETDPLHNITVEVTDGGTSQLSSVCSLVIELLDVDENRFYPQFTQFAFRGEVKENERIGTKVAELSAVDEDNPDEVPAYAIVGGDGIGLFHIDSHGTIATLEVLDRETKSFYWLKVSATDSGNQGVPKTSYTDVYIEVLDDNDHIPQMKQYLYFGTVTENSGPDTLVTRLSAWDKDSGTKDDPSLNYRIIRGDPQSFFKIDPPDIGYITTHSRKLDREAQDKHTLEVEVRDVVSGLASVAVVVVHVHDVNDNAPKFDTPIYNFDIPPITAENQMTVCRVFASDRDSGTNRELYYNISNSPDHKKFSIISETGEVRANGEIKPGDTFHLTIEVSDGGTPSLSSETQVVMVAQASPMVRGGSNKDPIVERANDIHISENEEVGEFLGLLEAADADNDHLWFDILDGNVNSVFSLRKDTGNLQIAKPLNTINDTSVLLTYSVSDGIASVSAKVKIHIDRSLNIRPEFSESEYVLNISEHAEVGTDIVTLQAHVDNLHDIVGLTYTLHTVESVTSNSKFKVDARSGRVILVQKLDHEQIKVHRLVVAVRYRQLINFATIIINVQDVNDHSPEFLDRDYVAKVLETAAVGTIVLQVMAVDKDSGMNGVIGYTIISGNEQGLWSMDAETGELSVARVLSLDLPETVLVVRASDRGHPLRSDSTTVRVLVVMHHSSPPRFHKHSYNTQFNEDISVGTHLMSVYADSPSGVRYSILPPADHIFDIHPTSGAISLRKSVDFEEQFYLNFTVMATSTAGLTGRATVRVSVVDSNDHHPVFHQQFYEGVVPENTPAGTVVITAESSKESSPTPLVVSAVDNDQGSNAVVSYEIDDPWARQYFSIDFGTGAVRTSVPLDFERRKSFEFEVMAADHGIPTRQSILPALVRVTVIDTNDHKPEFVNKDVKTSIYVPSAADVVIVRMRALDNDSVGEISFYPADISDPVSKLFTIHPKSGIIKMAVDDIQIGIYKYKVGVTDGVHRSTTTVTIGAHNLPPNSALTFSQEKYYVNVYENTTSNELQHVIAVYAMGADLGEQIHYKLLNSQPWFVVNSVTGVVSTTGIALDREERSTRRLVIQAFDQSVPPNLAQALVIVNVLDTNDCSPEFVNKPYYAVVPLDAEVGDNVTYVKAIDKDQGSNGQVLYQLHSQDPFAKLHFRINAEDGRIFVSTPFAQSTKSLDLYMTVTANDQGSEPLSSSAIVRVKVVDRATPVFGKAFYQVHVSEGSSVGSVVLSVSALSNVGGFIGYSIISGDKMDQFDVDYLSGSLTIGRKLDRETQSMYNLTVRAMDVSRNGIHADVPVVVYVDDVNDNPPIFEKKSYNLQISEATPMGSDIGTVMAIDKDQGPNAVVTYSLKDSDFFEIGRTSGILYLKKPLDFENSQHDTVEVVATDGGSPALNRTATVNVRVLDVNDNAPVFAQSVTSVRVNDDTAAGRFIAVLSAWDPDSMNDQVSASMSFSILSGDALPALFSIGSDNGIVRTARNLGSQTLGLQPNYVLNVSVSDGVFSSYAKLNISIMPTVALTEPPAFERTHFMAAVKENGVAQTVVTSVVAFGGTPPLEISFGGASNAPFGIDPKTGQVVTKSALDFEVCPVYRLPVIARDAAGRQAFAELSVNVLDDNDNTPRFVADKYELIVAGNATIGSHVVQLVAHDMDKKDLVEYAMIESPITDKSVDIWRLFRLQGGQGVLTVKSDLSQFVGTKIELTIRATDEGNPPLHSDVPVSIDIVAADKPMPLFTKPRYIFHVAEDVEVGGVVGVVETVLNGNLQPNMKTFLKIVPLAKDEESFPFSIQQNSGELSVIESLDRESRAEFEFMIASGVMGVNDKPSGEGLLALVIITIDDVNDNAPKFESSYTSLEISEDASVGSSLAVISASDADMGAASTVYFRLNHPHKYFKMDETSGWLLLDKSLDRETKASHQLEIEAFDGGMPSLVTRLNVTINVIDANDQAPTFEKALYKLSVSESVEPGQIVGEIKAIDSDLPPNNVTSLYIVDGDRTGHFLLSSTGVLTVRKKLDFETKSVYTLRVLASDGKHTATCRVVIMVEDANDNAPRCEVDSRVLYIPEDMEQGSTVFTLVADDADSGAFAELVYSVEGSHLFAMSLNGNLVTVDTLDREMDSSIELNLYATDVGGLDCSTSVHIIVTDVNDNPPVFHQQLYQITVKENLPEGPTFLLRLKAKDKDEGAGGRIQYALESTDYDGLFSVDEMTGALLLLRPLDREERDTYEINVIAMDQDPNKQLKASAKVVLSVADVNDNAPEFVNQEYEVDVLENESPGYKLIQVHATSLDTGANANIRYKLVQPESAWQIFNVDPESGQLTLKISLDYEVEKIHALTIMGTDGGSPPLSATCRVNVKVVDVNDHQPKFTQPLVQLRVREDVQTETEIMKLTAHDDDGGGDDNLTYRMDSTSSNALPFTVTSDGSIILSQGLDREKISAYRFVVEVMDSGSPPLQDKSVVQVVVLDVNDNPPKFDNCNLTIVLEEDSPLGLALLDVQVSDVDSSDNGPPFKFNMIGNGADRFSVDNDGVISQAKPIAYLDKALYLLTVSVADSGSPPLTAECPLSVHILEKSKHPPEMNPGTTHVLVYMNEFPGGRIAKMIATDKDPRDVVTYALHDQSQVNHVASAVSLESPFSIISESGWVSASGGLSEGRHVLNVSASDIRFTTYAPLVVNVRSVPKEALQYAVAIKFQGISARKFIENIQKRFIKTLAKMLSVNDRQIQILSMQGSDENNGRGRVLRSVVGDNLQMLFTVTKGKTGYYKPQFVRRRMEGRIKELDEELGVEVIALVTEVCRRDLCVKGVCREKLTLDDINIVTVVTNDGQAFVSPTHKWTHECMCQNGFGGASCDVPVNACSRDLCPSKQLCIPMDTPMGYKCSCPPEKKGSLCNQNICEGSECSSGETAVTFTGKNFIRYALSTDLDKRLELAVDLRTVAPQGIIMHAAGQTDFNTLEVSNGFIQYRFDCGSGEGLVRISDVTVTDGNWHLISVVRRGRHAKLTLDSKFTAESFSPPPNAVLNLDSTYVYFGARVLQGPTFQNDVFAGFTGCINRIYVDGFELNRGRPGIHFDNVQFGCSDSFIAGVCSSQPCQNLGSCVPMGQSHMYTCQCHPRFTGRNCEIDLNPCATKPCAIGSVCQNLHNDFECKCKPGFTGKTCRTQGFYDACVVNPCGEHGTCKALPQSSYECRCTGEWSGYVCDVPPGGGRGAPIEGTPWGISIPEIIAIAIVLILLVVLTVIIACCCRKCTTQEHRYTKAAIREPNNEMMMDVPMTRNALHFNDDKAPPPLPPRGCRGPFGNASRHSKLSNLECAQMTGLPTGLVRPLPITDRQYSPSLDEHCPDRHGASNLQQLHNYGSAAEELERLSRYDVEIMQTFGKPQIGAGVNVHRAGSSGDSVNGRAVSGGGPHVQQDWKQAVDMLSLDSIDRIKREQKAADELSARAERSGPSLGGAQSLASIQCLPEDEPNPAYHWDYSDWNSTLGQTGYAGATMDSRRSDLITDDEDGAPLPQGVSAIDDTDSEFVADIEQDDELSCGLHALAPSVDFKKQLMQLQKLAERANHSPKQSPAKKPPPAPEPEDEYVTMKPLSNYQRHLDKYLPKQRVPDSAQSQRRPLLQDPPGGDGSDLSSDDSDGSNAVVHFGRSPSRVPPGHMATKLQLHTYDCPPTNRRRSEDSNANLDSTRPLRRDDSIPLMDDDNDTSFNYPQVTVAKDTTV